MADNIPLQLIPGKTQHPVPAFNVTKAGFRPVQPGRTSGAPIRKDSTITSEAEDNETGTAPDIALKWTARNNRKGRHALVVKDKDIATPTYNLPAYSNSYSEISRGVWRMVSHYPFWDISWLVALSFVLGSVVWAVNALFLFLPYLDRSRDFHELELYGGGITAFVASILFEIGSLLLLIEALYASRSGCLGWDLDNGGEEASSNGTTTVRALPDKSSCRHHHASREHLVGTLPIASSKPSSWWPTDYHSHGHYLRDLGFLASIAALLGSTFFVVSGFGSLPSVYNHWQPESKLVMYWLPQVVGGVFYMIASILFMVETQRSWWRPAPRMLRWHVGFWFAIGGAGFLLFPIFALHHTGWSEYQAACANFWGSWAFLLSSILQLYESLNKYPVERHW